MVRMGSPVRVWKSAPENSVIARLREIQETLLFLCLFYVNHLSTKFRFSTVFLRLFSPFISPHFKLSPKQTSIIYCKQGNEPCKYLLEVITHGAGERADEWIENGRQTGA